jgi:hypothetical protein
MTMGAGGTTATINPGAGAKVGNTATSRAPISVTPISAPTATAATLPQGFRQFQLGEEPGAEAVGRRRSIISEILRSRR